MKKLTLKHKIYLHVFIPVTAVFILNNLMLMNLETPGYLIINLISFAVVVTISILTLSNFQDKNSKQIVVETSLEGTLDELSQDAEKIDEIYIELKELLSTCCQKESLPIAKELARICTDLGPVAADLKDKLEDRKAPKESPFKPGTLRRVYRIQAA